MATEIVASPDRTAVILIMAWLDEAMTARLKATLRDDPAVFNEITSPASGALGPFSARNRLLYLLGAYTDETRRDLALMAKMRNAAAHLTEPFSFSNPTLRQQAESLTVHDRMWRELDDDLERAGQERRIVRSRPFTDFDARLHFIDCASIVANMLFQTAEWSVTRHAPKLPYI